MTTRYFYHPESDCFFTTEDGSNAVEKDPHVVELSKKEYDTGKLTPDAKELYKGIQMCDGFEVEKDSWHVAEELEKAGLITFGPARGPNKAFRRAELIDDED